MFKFLKRKYPKRITTVWYNQSIHCEDEEFPIVFDENERYIDCKKGLKVAMFRDEKERLVWYEVTDWTKRVADFVYPSDGIKCDLKYSHTK